MMAALLAKPLADPLNPFQDRATTNLSGLEVGLRPRQLDALFLPTHRQSSVALTALEKLAQSTETLWLLPSGRAVDAIRSLKHLPPNVHSLVEIPFDRLQKMFLSLNSSRNPSQNASLTYDLPLKRNVALVIAERYGFERIGLLDDDILIDPSQISAAAEIISPTTPVAGFYVFDYPDVSTTEHIERLVCGSVPRTMPGGNCLFLYRPSISGFFPYVYNDDWLFVYHNLRGRCGAAMGAARQTHHEPWKDPGRLRFEEFGELLLTGVFHQRQECLPEDDLLRTTFWQARHTERCQWLAHLLVIAEAGESPAKQALLFALRTSQEVLASIPGDACATFIASLSSDTQEDLWKPNIENYL